jgi:hypothetical protein
MSLKNRVQNLERRSGTDEGYIYFVMVADGIFTLKANGADILKSVEMSESEFAEWENTISQNSQVYVISVYED